MYPCSAVLVFVLFTAISCHKKEIQFGDHLAESHTRLVTIDTVTPVMSTYVLDSFPTSGASICVVGRYSDSYLGITTASTYLQFGLPALSDDVATLFPSHARFDSLTLIMKPDGYYYGDTSQPFSISAHQLAAQPDYTYANKLYNTSSVNLLSGGLGHFSKPISPVRRDTVKITLPATLGQDFFDKIRSSATQFKTEDNFLNYFRGICVQPQVSATGALYSFAMGDSSVRLRLHYHLTLPHYESKYIDFYVTRTSYHFNRIVTDRTGTTLERTTPKQREFFANAQHPYAFTQSATGVLLKIKFPSLRELLKIDDVVRLMDAKLILKPVNQSFDMYTYMLPPQLYMAQTDATNSIGSPLADSSGALQYRAPYIDRLYGVNTAYTFDLTSFANALFNTEGTAENGVFILQEEPSNAQQFNRAVFGSRQNQKYQTKLVITLMIID
mgnify:CR=1 FL=1